MTSKQAPEPRDKSRTKAARVATANRNQLRRLVSTAKGK